jgi:hypothetical protein
MLLYPVPKPNFKVSLSCAYISSKGGYLQFKHARLQTLGSYEVCAIALLIIPAHCLHCDATLQRVFDPITRTVVHLTPLPAEHGLGDDLSFLGAPVPDSEACAIADGLMDPVTRQMFKLEELDPAAAQQKQQQQQKQCSSSSSSSSGSSGNSSCGRQPLQQRNSNIPTQQQQQQPCIKAALQKSATAATNNSNSSTGMMWRGRWQPAPAGVAALSKPSRLSTASVMTKQKTLNKFFAPVSSATPATKQQQQQQRSSSGSSSSRSGSKRKTPKVRIAYTLSSQLVVCV